jgi:multidrug transporter EmrE-like cation transporter
VPDLNQKEENNIMSPALIALLAIYTCLSVLGLYKIKEATLLLSWPFVLGFTMYGVGFLIWLHMLKKFPLSIIFPLCASCILIGTQFVGWLLLHEVLTIRKVIAVLCALVATILISLEI